MNIIINEHLAKMYISWEMLYFVVFTFDAFQPTKNQHKVYLLIVSNLFNAVKRLPNFGTYIDFVQAQIEPYPNLHYYYYPTMYTSWL